MNKNGFIATSLIYTFFIMFVVLFSSVIAKFVDNKNLLDTTEKTIKDDLNTIIGIRDFEPGNMVAFVDDCSNIGEPNIYIVANVNIPENYIVLYSYNLSETKSIYDLEYLNHIKGMDILEYASYYNETYFDKIIYFFDKTKSKSYDLNGYYIYKKNDPSDDLGCIPEYITTNWCIKEGANPNIEDTIYYRKRIVYRDLNSQTKRCNIISGDGTIYIDSAINLTT